MIYMVELCSGDGDLEVWFIESELGEGEIDSQIKALVGNRYFSGDADDDVTVSYLKILSLERAKDEIELRLKEIDDTLTS
jgi:hypothetical protein